MSEGTHAQTGSTVPGVLMGFQGRERRGVAGQERVRKVRSGKEVALVAAASPEGPADIAGHTK